MEIKNIIKEQIDTFYKISHKANIEVLLKLQEKLSANLYYYADVYREVMIEYAQKYWDYKSKYSKIYLENIAKKIEEKMTSKQAEEIAKEESMAERASQMFLSAEIEAMKVEIRSIEKVLHTLSQRISNLKKEKEMNNFKT